MKTVQDNSSAFLVRAELNQSSKLGPLPIRISHGCTNEACSEWSLIVHAIWEQHCFNWWTRKYGRSKLIVHKKP